MNIIRLREFSSLSYRDPRPFLLQLRELEISVALSDLPDDVRALRTNELKPWRELREAALFCYFMGQRIDRPVLLAKGESQDYDFVATWQDGATRNYTPVQLKELVPPELNVTATLTSVLESLVKYTDSPELAVAVHLNRQVHFVPEEVVVPTLAVAEIWMFGTTSADQNQWALWGDFLRFPQRTNHEYPAANPAAEQLCSAIPC